MDNTSAPPNASAPSGGHIHSHHHGHHHHLHAHAHGGNFAEANKEFYNATSNDFDNYPHAKERAIRTALAIREAVPLTKESSTVLEFACGTGLVVKEFLPYVKEIVGVDISSGVVERCNSRLKELGANEGCMAIAANIVTEKNTVFPGRTFDLVYCASAYHHLDSPEEITKLLADYVKPGGSLVIVDNIMKEGETVEEKHKAYVTRYGFTEDEMKELFAQAGVEFVSYAQVPPDEGDRDIFISKAIKPA